jgi:hypothetical protein
MTDRWGNIPYKDALKGNLAYSRAYDKQEDFSEKCSQAVSSGDSDMAA